MPSAGSRPHVRRRSNDNQSIDVQRKRGSLPLEEQNRQPLASLDRSTGPRRAIEAPRKVRTNVTVDIFVDKKRKRPSVDRREAGRASVAREADISTSDEESGSEDEFASDEETQSVDSAFLLSQATAQELRKLAKEQLVELAQQATGQTGRALEALTKAALAEAIINKRPSSSNSALKPKARTLSLERSMVDLSLTDRSPPTQRTARFTRSVSDQTQSGARKRRTRPTGASLPLSEDNRHVAFQEVIEISSGSEDEAEKRKRWREPTPALKREATPVAHRTRRRSSKTNVPATPAIPKQYQNLVVEPEDDESGTEGGDESTEMIDSGEHASPRRLRNGKVVVLEDEEEEESTTDELEDPDEDDLSGSDDDIELSREHLSRMKRDDLIQLCEDREIECEGTKKDLVEALLVWQSEHVDGDYEPTDSAPSSSSSVGSIAIGKSSKHETKTQALAAIESIPSDISPRPRLLTSEAKTITSSRPETPNEESDEEVETLDLDELGLTDKAIAADKLKRGEKIGSGGFKDVYIGKYRNVKVAIADLRDGLTENDIKELLLLRDLQHVNIVRFIGVSVPEEPRTGNEPACTLVTELCPNGDLFDYLRSGVEAPSQKTLFQMMHDITCGLEYLHQRTPRIIHRDMKSSNVLITAKGVAKINDFGLARVKTSTRSVIKSLVGTVNWQAPELWAAKPKYNEKVDVYATGLVFWEMLQFHMPTKRYPFEGSNEHAIYRDAGQLGLRPPTATMGRKWGADILELVNKMWAQQAADRPSMTEVRLELEELIANA